MSKILIVEDEANVRDTLALNLRTEGYEVFTAVRSLAPGVQVIRYVSG